jgi:hypothetical protein
MSAAAADAEQPTLGSLTKFGQVSENVFELLCGLPLPRPRK